MAPSQALARVLCVCLLVIGTLIAVFSISAQDELNTHPANPAELLAAIDHADQIVVNDYDPEAEQDDQKILYSSTKRKDISELKQSIAIQPPAQWFRCACLPLLEIKLYRNGKGIGVISVFEEMSIELTGWTGAARVADQEKLLKWFAARKIPGPRPASEQ